MASKTNSRRVPRVPCSVPARAEGPRGPMRGVIRSLSQGGLYFAGAALPIGKSVELSVELPAGKIQAIGEVRYHLSSEQGAGMGIRFTRIEQDHLRRIDQYVAAHAA